MLCAISVSQMRVATSNQGMSVLKWVLTGRSDSCNSRNRYTHFFMSLFFHLLQKLLLILLPLPHHLLQICLGIQQTSDFGEGETQLLIEIIKIIVSPCSDLGRGSEQGLSSEGETSQNFSTVNNSLQSRCTHITFCGEEGGGGLLVIECLGVWRQRK